MARAKVFALLLIVNAPELLGNTPALQAVALVPSPIKVEPAVVKIVSLPECD